MPKYSTFQSSFPPLPSDEDMPGTVPDAVTPQVKSDDDLLDPAETAVDLNCSKSYLDKLRVYGGGPPFIRLGPRMIRYRRGDARARRFNSTSEYKK
jgi:hypothetical protein